jgi:hypothetical protein
LTEARIGGAWPPGQGFAAGFDWKELEGNRQMKDWSGKNLCFECAKKLGANINIGHKLMGRCHRCHSEQTLFRVTGMPTQPIAGEDICPECAHPVGTHAAACPRSDLEILKREQEELVRVLEEFAGYDPEASLASQFRQILQRAQKISGQDKGIL